MISDEELEQLRFKGESTDLDFKQAQYPFASATDHQKSELLKDILAMANAYRSGTGYILIGFKDQPPHAAEVVGIASGDHIDDASLQQFVGSKVAPQLDFHYEERVFDGAHVALIVIPKQPRPFAATKDFGRVEKSVIYVRRGSSTDEASMPEVAKMVLADAGTSKSAQVELRLDNEINEPIPERVELLFWEFEQFPDYEPPRSIDMGHGLRMPMPHTGLVNRHYYQEGAEYFSAESRKIVVRLSLANRSDFSIGDAKVELWCSTPEGAHVHLLRSDDLPGEPDSDHLSVAGNIHSVARQLRERVSVEERGSHPVCHVLLGTLRPGETGIAESDIALLPSGPGEYKLNIRILAKEIAKPIVREYPITVDGEIRRMELDDLIRMLYTDHFTEER
jgi:hypothetical protein